MAVCASLASVHVYRSTSQHLGLVRRCLEGSRVYQPTHFTYSSQYFFSEQRKVAEGQSLSTRLGGVKFCGLIVTSAASDDLAGGDSSSSRTSELAPSTLPQYKHVLLPVIDRNPFLSEATRNTIAVASALAKQHSADITVVVIDEDQKEDITDHNQRLSNIRWHLNEHGFNEFALLERLGEGKMPAAVIGEVADELSLDLVVLSMDTIHSKHIDANLLAEFVPCQVLFLPL